MHRKLLAVLLLVELCAPLYPAAYYHLVARSRLVARGAVSCAGYTPRQAGEMPGGCDLAILSEAGDTVDETYIARHATTRTTVRSIGGRWVSSEVANEGVEAALLFPMAAFAAGALVAVRKAARTGDLFSWQLARHPFDRFEKTVLFYAVPVFLLGLAIGPLTAYVPVILEAFS